MPRVSHDLPSAAVVKCFAAQSSYVAGPVCFHFVFADVLLPMAVVGPRALHLCTLATGRWHGISCWGPCQSVLNQSACQAHRVCCNHDLTDRVFW
jgi:hypothetical protein